MVLHSSPGIQETVEHCNSTGLQADASCCELETRPPSRKPSVSPHLDDENSQEIWGLLTSPWNLLERVQAVSEIQRDVQARNRGRRPGLES